MTEWPFKLNDEQWQSIKRHLPIEGPTFISDRNVVSAIVHKFQSNCSWRRCSCIYGQRLAVLGRYLQWRRQAIWNDIKAIIDAETKSRDLTLVAMLVPVVGVFLIV